MGASKSETGLDRLRGVVTGFTGQRFAVVDGGGFPDLPSTLRRKGLFARSLFLDVADSEVQAAGPWLVSLDQAPEASECVFDLVGDRPAAVYWCCGHGEAALWRHLRGLAMVRIPGWAAKGESIAPDAREPDFPEMVFFRHFDPRVLGSLLPVLDAAQLKRVLGPATEIAFVTTDFGGLRRVIDDERWPPAPAGPLVIRGSQIEALNGRRLSASHRRIASFLRSVAPQDVGSASDADLKRHVEISDETGRHLGLDSEAAHADGAF